jgi:HrpA-like RNA helicase
MSSDLVLIRLLIELRESRDEIEECEANEEDELRGGQTTEEALPIDEHRESIISHIRNNRITVVRGETGNCT